MFKKGQRIRAGSDLTGFDDAARAALDGMMATFGFLPEMSRVDQNFALRRWRNGHRYVSVEARTHLSETPTGRIRFGTGSSDWPEADWNHICLTNLLGRKLEHDPADYLLEGRTMAWFLQQVVRDLQDHAMEFISGELRDFKKIRAEVVRKREPFQPAIRQSYNESTLNFLKSSRELKKKYSEVEAA